MLEELEQLNLGLINCNQNAIVQFFQKLGNAVKIEHYNLEDYKIYSQKVDVIYIYLSNSDLQQLEPLVLLKEKEILSNLPVFIIIDNYTELNKSMAYEMGIKGYLAQPLTFEEVQESINDAKKLKFSGKISHSHYRDFDENEFTIDKMSIDERELIENANKLLIDLNNKLISHSFDDIISFALEGCIHITKSKIGYFHFVDFQRKIIKLHTWSIATLGICEIDLEHLDREYPFEKAGIWIDCLYTKKIAVHNDYEKALNKKGIPEGHVFLKRDLAVPIIEAEEPVAIIGIGNKEDIYTELDRGVMNFIATNLWSIILRKKAEEKLKEESDYVKLLMDTSALLV